MINNNIQIILLSIIMSVMIMGNIMMVIINPEAYFFGYKLGGISAAIYLLTNSFLNFTIVFFLITSDLNLKIMIFTLIYFIYGIIESNITSLILFHEYNFPIIFVIGFLMTLIAIFKNRHYWYDVGKKKWFQKN